MMTQNTFIINPEEYILVTGANGFIGAQVVRTLLDYGFQRVKCLTRASTTAVRLETLIKKYGNKKVIPIKGNLLSPDLCDRAVRGVSIIYHLAAGIEKSFSGCYLNSVVTTRNLVEAALKQKAIMRFVNVSSIAVYSNENIPRGGVLDETCKMDTEWMRRFEAYSYGKAKQDELVLEYKDKEHLPLVIVRPSVVYGPGKAKITDRIGTDVFGLFLHLGLSNKIPLTYLDNCAEAIVLAGLARGIEGEIFNIVDDDLPTSRSILRKYKRQVKDFISIPVPYPLWYLFCSIWEKYSKWSNGQLPPVFNRRTCELYWKNHVYPNQKAKERLGWQPRVATEQGLANFFIYMNEKASNV